MCLCDLFTSAAVESGDVAKVYKFLQHLFPVGAKIGGAELKCMRRAVSLLDTRWKAEENRKRKATFSSEDKVPTTYTCRLLLMNAVATSVDGCTLTTAV